MDYTRMVVDYLNGLNLGATAYREVPANRPTDESPSRPFLVVELTGGAGASIVQRSPSIDVDCWASRQHDAEILAFEVVNALLVMPDALPNVFGASVSTVYSNPDPDSGTPRYTVGCDLETNE